MKFRLVLSVVLAFLLTESPSLADQQQSKPLRQGELTQLLKKGGHVLIIRHERTEVPSREDDYSRPSDDCRAQRNMSIAGLAGAQAPRQLGSCLVSNTR